MALKPLALLAFQFVLAVSIAAEESGADLKAEMLDCAFKRQGALVDASLYSDGKVRFSYTLLKVTEERPYVRLYVAFWNPAKTEGQLFVFHVSATSDQKPALALVNQAWIWDNKGHLDIRDIQGGVYVYEQSKAQLPKLKRRRTIVFLVSKIRTTPTACSYGFDG